MKSNTKTQDMLVVLEGLAFLSKAEALGLAVQALTDYGRTSPQADALESAVWDMVIADGCPNRVYNKVQELIGHYTT